MKLTLTQRRALDARSPVEEGSKRFILPYAGSRTVRALLRKGAIEVDRVIEHNGSDIVRGLFGRGWKSRVRRYLSVVYRMKRNVA
jgi:hypothetical protein